MKAVVAELSYPGEEPFDRLETSDPHELYQFLRDRAWRLTAEVRVRPAKEKACPNCS